MENLLQATDAAWHVNYAAFISCASRQLPWDCHILIKLDNLVNETDAACHVNDAAIHVGLL